MTTAIASTFIFNAENRDSIIARLGKFLSAWPKDKPCEITVKRFVRSRSNRQNAALWGVAYKVLSDATGYTAEEMHTYFCMEFFGAEEYKVFGQRRRRPRRTTTTDENGNRDVLSTEDFCAFYAFIQQRAAETVQINVPDPDSNWYAKKARKAAA